MAFGLSGSETSSQMEGADAVIAYVDGTRGYAVDYNITAKAPVRKYQEHYQHLCYITRHLLILNANFNKVDLQ